MKQNLKLETLAVQAGYTPENGGPRIVPIVQSTTYKYDDAQSVADLFDLKRPGFFYTRLANPTVDCFEKKCFAQIIDNDGKVLIQNNTGNWIKDSAWVNTDIGKIYGKEPC